MESPSWSPVDCPACGAAAETNDAVATADGLDFACLCGLWIVAGAVVERGTGRAPEDIDDDSWWPLPVSLRTPTYRAPGERRHVLRLVPVYPSADDAGVETPAAPPEPALVRSVMVRFHRPRRTPDDV
jgi:hypothetical protein